MDSVRTRVREGETARRVCQHKGCVAAAHVRDEVTNPEAHERVRTVRLDDNDNNNDDDDDDDADG